MANKKANKKVSAKAIKQQPRSDAQKRKDRPKGKQSGSWSGDGLSQQLQRLGLRIVEVESDGNCLFRALGDQLFGQNNDHIRLRREVVGHVQAHPDDFAAFVEDDEDFDSYCKRLHEDGTWAGNIELQAASLVYNVNISVHQADQPVWTIQNFDEGKGQRAHHIRLSYHNGDHYNSVRLSDDCGQGPAQEARADELAAATAETPSETPSWGKPEEQLVERGTGCNDPRAVTAALTRSNGNVDKAIEGLIEQLAAGVALSEQPTAATTPKGNAAAERSNSGAADAVQSLGDPSDDNDNSSRSGTGLAQQGDQVRSQEKHKRERDQKHPPRNRPCPCGSKAKYKNCCGLAARLKREASPSVVDAGGHAMPLQLLV